MSKGWFRKRRPLRCEIAARRALGLYIEIARVVDTAQLEIFNARARGRKLTHIRDIELYKYKYLCTVREECESYISIKSMYTYKLSAAKFVKLIKISSIYGTIKFSFHRVRLKRFLSAPRRVKKRKTRGEKRNDYCSAPRIVVPGHFNCLRLSDFRARAFLFHRYPRIFPRDCFAPS